MNQQSPCRFYPCRCFTLGSGISCQVYNALYQPTGQFRASSSQANVTNKIIAVKQINADHAATKYAHIEIDILKSLNHVNIVALLEVMPMPGGKIALGMERCDGNLDGLVKRPEHFWGLTTPLLLSLVTQYTAGFRYLYEKGVCHRDIKPLNILYNINSSIGSAYGRRDEYIFKLADFGVAKKTGEQDILKSLVGTPEFLCPEVIRGKYGPTADLWSAAVMIYYCIAGHLPFIGRDFHSKFANYLMLLASSRKYDDIAAFCGSSDLSQVEFSKTLPVYCQLQHRLKKVFEHLLRLMLSSALGHLPSAGSQRRDILGTLASGDGELAESGKKIFDEFFKYVKGITEHCWFHVFDIATFSVSAVHVTQKAFQKNDLELSLAVEEAVVKAVGNRPLMVIGVENTANFRGRLVFEGGVVGFRSRFLSGTLTDSRKTMLVCLSGEPSSSASASTIASSLAVPALSDQNGNSNPIRSGFESLMSELFIRREIDAIRTPKVTALYFERCVCSVSAGVFPAISSYRSAVQAKIDGAKKVIAFAHLTDMIAETFEQQLNEAVQLMNATSDEKEVIDSLNVMSACLQRAQALSHQCEAYTSISPVGSAAQCNSVTDGRHKDLTQLVLAATNNGRAEINKTRIKTVSDFMTAADKLLIEMRKIFLSLAKAVEIVEKMELELFAFLQPTASHNNTIKPSVSLGGPAAAAGSVNAIPYSLQNSISSAVASDGLPSSLATIEASLSSINGDPQLKRSLAVLLKNLSALEMAVSNKTSVSP